MIYVANSEELNVYFCSYLVNESCKNTFADIDLCCYVNVDLYYFA